jgi:hypothetical protein
MKTEQKKVRSVESKPSAYSCKIGLVTKPDGGKDVFLQVGTEDNSLSCGLAMSPAGARLLADRLKIAADKADSGIVIPTAEEIAAVN